MPSRRVRPQWGWLVTRVWADAGVAEPEVAVSEFEP